MIKQAYIKGFMRKCAEYGIDSRNLIAYARYMSKRAGDPKEKVVKDTAAKSPAKEWGDNTSGAIRAVGDLATSSTENAKGVATGLNDLIDHTIALGKTVASGPKKIKNRVSGLGKDVKAKAKALSAKLRAKAKQPAKNNKSK